MATVRTNHALEEPQPPSLPAAISAEGFLDEVTNSSAPEQKEGICPPPLPPRPSSTPRTLAGDEWSSDRCKQNNKSNIERDVHIIPPPLPPRPQKWHKTEHQDPLPKSHGSKGRFESSCSNSQHEPPKSSRVHLPQREILKDIVEKNPNGEKRVIYLKWRPLRGRIKSRGFGAFLNPFATIDSFCHYGVEIGEYTHEMLVDDNEPHREVTRWSVDAPLQNGQRPWKEDIGKVVCGTTMLTDLEIRDKAIQVFKKVMITGDQKYDHLRNNCQRFARKLAIAITEDRRRAKLECAYFMATSTMPIEHLLAFGVGGAVILVQLLLWFASRKSFDQYVQKDPRRLKIFAVPAGHKPHDLLLEYLAPFLLGVGIIAGLGTKFDDQINKLLREEEFRKKYPSVYEDVFGRPKTERRILHRAVVFAHDLL